MRIISGKYRGKTLARFNDDFIRPTLDRVKEAVFSKLQFRFEGANVLDLFGGTGNLGLEAFSRGANVDIVDCAKTSVDVIRKNASSVNFDGRILQLDYTEALNKFSFENKKFDIIFIDPPYKSDCGIRAIELIARYDLLNDGGIIVFEHLKEDKYKVTPDGLTIFDEKYYGIVATTFIEVYNSDNGQSY